MGVHTESWEPGRTGVVGSLMESESLSEMDLTRAPSLPTSVGSSGPTHHPYSRDSENWLAMRPSALPGLASPLMSAAMI